ncbi:hypothetical protein SSX86_030087 [Deinandra increscens subsp. villosa]|uniref:Uncharacterized protein n=1 Tax=Deinandra increscens subsp. villosa TaxID=3103831 RepID=A0AAP0CHJ2_9ASTR
MPIKISPSRPSQPPQRVHRSNGRDLRADVLIRNISGDQPMWYFTVINKLDKVQRSLQTYRAFLMVKKLNRNNSRRVCNNSQICCKGICNKGFQMDQQKQLFQQQRVMPEASSASLDSTALTLNGGDWQEEIYQKITIVYLAIFFIRYTLHELSYKSTGYTLHGMRQKSTGLRIHFLFSAPIPLELTDKNAI